jgi:putative transposase
MPRSQRIQFPGACYHVTTRGNDKQEIFISDKDRHRFIVILQEVVHTQSWVLHAYCLMGNHYHLLVETPEANLAYGMQRLNGHYCGGFNKIYKRVGHVVQGRYHSRLIRDDRDFLAVTRYVVLNPVKDGMVQQPGDWRWSSYPATAGFVCAPSFLEVHHTLSLFSDKEDHGREEFKSFISQELELLRSSDNSLESIFRRVTDELTKKMAIRQARYQYDFSPREIALYLNVHPATIYRVLKQ